MFPFSHQRRRRRRSSGPNQSSDPASRSSQNNLDQPDPPSTDALQDPLGSSELYYVFDPASGVFERTSYIGPPFWQSSTSRGDEAPHTDESTAPRDPRSLRTSSSLPSAWATATTSTSTSTSARTEKDSDHEGDVPKRRKLDQSYEMPPRSLRPYGIYGQVDSGVLDMEIVNLAELNSRGEVSGHLKPENVLKNDESVYFMADSSRIILLQQKGESPFMIEDIVIQTPKRESHYPVQEGLIFVGMDAASLILESQRYNLKINDVTQADDSTRLRYASPDVEFEHWVQTRELVGALIGGDPLPLVPRPRTLPPTPSSPTASSSNPIQTAPPVPSTDEGSVPVATAAASSINAAAPSSNPPLAPVTSTSVSASSSSSYPLFESSSESSSIIPQTSTPAGGVFLREHLTSTSRSRSRSSLRPGRLRSRIAADRNIRFTEEGGIIDDEDDDAQMNDNNRDSEGGDDEDDGFGIRMYDMTDGDEDGNESEDEDGDGDEDDDSMSYGSLSSSTVNGEEDHDNPILHLLATHSFDTTRPPPALRRRPSANSGSITSSTWSNQTNPWNIPEGLPPPHRVEVIIKCEDTDSMSKAEQDLTGAESGRTFNRLPHFSTESEDEEEYEDDDMYDDEEVDAEASEDDWGGPANEWNDALNSAFSAHRMLQRPSGSMLFETAQKLCVRSTLEIKNPDGASGQVAPPLIAPHAMFFIPRRKNRATIRFNPPLTAKYVLLKLFSPSPKGMMTVQHIAVRGRAGPQFFPAAAIR